MNDLVSEHRRYLNAFMKTAQYLASLTTHEDVWLHISQVMVEFYGAGLAGFAARDHEGNPGFHHLKLPIDLSESLLETREVLEAVEEVLENGFLALRTLPAGKPYEVVFLPVTIANETAAVMLVGHPAPGPIGEELLNVYLAVAGLAGATVTRLQSENELKTHRTRLEELVAERTVRLTRAMERLEVEISERVQAEEALRGAKDELEHRVMERTLELTRANLDLREKTRIAQTLLDALPHVALLLTADRVVVGSNKKAADSGVLPGMRCYEGRNGPGPCSWCRAEGAIECGNMDHREVEVGDECWEIYWVPISSDLFLHYSFDITERKKAERELKAYAGKLEFLNEELQEFAFVASHDLQEPLRKIQTFGQLLAGRYRDSLGAEGQDYLGRLTRSAGRMSELLQSLLDYSRVATRQKPFAPTDLAEVARDAASDLELVIKRAAGSVEIGELPAIEADSVQMRQLFQNLIGNAMKYAREFEAPVVRINAHVHDGICRLMVEDNGIGFDEQYSERIFRPFQRLHGRTSKYDGTGMGLAICRKIVERHGGNILAKSTPGEGTTIVVQLPLRVVESL